MAYDIIRFTYTGADGERIPDEATHIFVDAAFIPPVAFFQHPNIIEVVCSKRVKKIGVDAFWRCPNLKRVIMPGVKEVEGSAFHWCPSLTDVECGKLEIIRKESAFSDCTSLTSIDLPSARIVAGFAFENCDALIDVKFSNKLESLGVRALGGCTSLERITIPLKDGLITEDDVFWECESLRRVDLDEGAVLQETVAALQLEEWRNDMNEEINSINHILPNARAGRWDYDADEYRGSGEKAQAIRRWIRSVIGKINHYKAEHQRILNEAATTLQCTLPHEIATNNVLTFLELPAHTFERANQEMGEDHIDEEPDDAVV